MQPSRSEQRLFDVVVKALAKAQYGHLRLTTPDGQVLVAGDPASDLKATIQLHTYAVLAKVVARGDIGFGESYIAGEWETDHLENLLRFFLRNQELMSQLGYGSWLNRLGFRLYSKLMRRNTERGSRNNIMAHYDVGNEFYKLWLDETMTYSAALYTPDSSDLKAAQIAKYQRILSKLNKAESVLEIGCGWGGFAEQAKDRISRITGVTISPAQHVYAQNRLGSGANIQLLDYRRIVGKFDAVVSIEMFEAVGTEYWASYFKKIADSLNPEGTAIVQTITIQDAAFKSYQSSSDFIRYYVFPGGMLPSPSRFKAEAAKAGLICKELFSFGQDYARTLREWGQRLEAQHAAITKLGYTEEFFRNWRFYLAFCAAGFAEGRTDVIQAEIVHAPQAYPSQSALTQPVPA